MLCNERSPIKLDEVNLNNNSFWDYPCYEETDGLFDNCGSDLFEPLFEIYRTRLFNMTYKPPSYGRMYNGVDAYGTFKDRKSLHY